MDPFRPKQKPLNAMDYIRQVIMPETGMNMAQARGAIKKKGGKYNWGDYRRNFLANQEALSKESAPDPVTTTQPSLMQQALDKEVEAKELMASGGDYMSAMREALALKVKAEQEAANPVTTQDPIDQGIGSTTEAAELPEDSYTGDKWKTWARDNLSDDLQMSRTDIRMGKPDPTRFNSKAEYEESKVSYDNWLATDPTATSGGSWPGLEGSSTGTGGTTSTVTQDPIDQGIGSAAVSEQGIPIEPPGLSILEKLKKDGGLPIGQVGGDQTDPITDPAEEKRLLEALIGDEDYQKKIKDSLEGQFQKIDFNAVYSDPVRRPEGFNPGDPGYNPAIDPIFVGDENKIKLSSGELVDPEDIDPLIEPAIVNPILNPKPPNPQELKDKYSDLDPGFFDAPEFQDYLSAGKGAATMDMYNSPYFGMGGSGSIGKAQDRAYEAYLDRIKSADAAPVVTDPITDMDPTQVDPVTEVDPIVSPSPIDTWTDPPDPVTTVGLPDFSNPETGRDAFINLKTSVANYGSPEAYDAAIEQYGKDWDNQYGQGSQGGQTGQAGGSPPATTTPAVPGTEVVPATPTTPPTTSAPATPTPGIPNLSDGIGAQLKQLFQQYMGSRQQYPNNYSNPMQQYRTAVTDTDEYKAYNDYASSLGPTEEQRAELQRLQSAFEGTDAYGQFNQQRQQRRNYMQPLGYGGGYGGGYGSGYGGGFQGGFGGYGGGYGGYQQPSYQQPYYQPPMQQQPYYGGGIMGGSSYGYPNNYSSYQQPYQQPYQMAQQYQQQPAYQSYGSVQPQYPTQYSSYASPFANSIR